MGCGAKRKKQNMECQYFGKGGSMSKEEDTVVMIDKHSGAVIVRGKDPCKLCSKNKGCDKSQIKSCFVPCG